ncbi:putative sterigmatocystin biosynthesis peroxidase stcC 1 [Colletotrichum chlorophyti]|uniref:Putative sterigmatocystin biosynthesis peroxidase stcC 1 n=1 Tax=Colletotrichum chlorophyti TaxID=708187 RepID=A0A1Q8S4R8_9PEZI|nr:putative sterigmatocystin biosynthesis peroxidase stcC 1 [Colletotrichum chlorophyti]
MPFRFMTFLLWGTLCLGSALPNAEDPKFPFQVPDPEANRSPCPFLNTLANHGYLPRDGKNISMTQFTTAFATALNFDENFVFGVAEPAFATSTTGNPKTVNLKDLEKHGVIEHDASLSRADVAVTGNANKFDAAVWNGVKAHFTGPTVDVKTMALARSDRIKVAKSTNPSFQLTEKQVGLTLAEAALALGVMAGDFKNPQAPTQYINILFEQERFPFNEGFKTSGTKLTKDMVEGLAGQIKQASPP